MGCRRDKRHLLYLLLAVLLYHCDSRPEDLVRIDFDPGLSLASVEVSQSDLINLQPSPLTILSTDSVLNSVDYRVDQPMMPLLVVQDSLYIPLYLEPGWELSITGDFSQLEDVLYHGNGADINQGLLDIYRIRKNLEQSSYWHLDLEAFLDRWDTVHHEFQQILGALKDEKAENILQMYFDSHQHMETMMYIMGHYNLYNGDEIPEALRGYKDLLLDPTPLELGLGTYSIALGIYLQAIIYPPLWGTSPPDSLRAHRTRAFPAVVYEALKNGEMNTKIKDYLVARHIYISFGIEGLTPEMEKVYWDFMKIYQPSDSSYIRTLERKYTEHVALQPGNVIPDLTGVTVSGDTMSIRDMTGKVVYLDMWATWCGPCIEEFPNSVALRQAYAKEDVTFLYLSVDSKPDKWQQYLQENTQLEGTHLRSTDIEKAYRSLQNTGIPRYVLLDANGHIVDAWAPRPGTIEIRELIDQLL